MVPGAGIEPARRLKREILSLLCLPISPSGRMSLLYDFNFFKVSVFCLSVNYSTSKPVSQCLFGYSFRFLDVTGSVNKAFVTVIIDGPHFIEFPGHFSSELFNRSQIRCASCSASCLFSRTMIASTRPWGVDLKSLMTTHSPVR